MYRYPGSGVRAMERVTNCRELWEVLVSRVPLSIKPTIINREEGDGGRPELRAAGTVPVLCSNRICSWVCVHSQPPGLGRSGYPEGASPKFGLKQS